MGPARQHVCEFTIPIEWEYVFTDRWGDERPPKQYDEVATGKRVIRLMCRCGSEVRR